MFYNSADTTWGKILQFLLNINLIPFKKKTKKQNKKKKHLSLEDLSLLRKETNNDIKLPLSK